MTSLALVLLTALSMPASPAGKAAATRPGGSASTQALPDADVAARVQAYLGAIDTPITVEQWRSLGAGAVVPLETVVADPTALPGRRAKALDALSAVGGTRAVDLVLQAARSEREPFIVRVTALRGATRLLAGPSLSKALLPLLTGARDVPVRATVAEVLARSADRRTCGAIGAQTQREARRDRTQFSRALQICASTAP